MRGVNKGRGRPPSGLVLLFGGRWLRKFLKVFLGKEGLQKFNIMPKYFRRFNRRNFAESGSTDHRSEDLRRFCQGRIGRIRVGPRRRIPVRRRNRRRRILLCEFFHDDLACGRSAVAEQMTHSPKFEGSNPGTVFSTRQ